MHGGDIYRNSVKYDFSVNLNPVRLPFSVKKKIKSAFNKISVYPDDECQQLRICLSKKYNVPAQNILCGNGASEILNGIFMAQKFKSVMMVAPCFSGYEKYAQIWGCGIQFLYKSASGSGCYEKDSFYDSLEKMLQETECDALFLTNPNNPDGKLMQVQRVKKIASLCKEKNMLLVLDECFMELACEENSFLPYISEFKNVIVINGFTKSFAAAGLRSGFAFSSDTALLQKIKNFLPEWNVSVISQEAGKVFCNQNKFLLKSRKYILREKNFLSEKLRNFGFEVYDSSVNFILFRICPEKEKFNLKEKLLKKKILIRDCSDFKNLGEGFYRIAVKNHTENKILIKSIKEILHG